MSELRQSVMLDADLMGSKRRFGLISQPPSTATGDDSHTAQSMVHINSLSTRKGENCNPITLPRNMLAGPNRSGVGRRVLFICQIASIIVINIQIHKI